MLFFFFQAEDGIRDLVRSRGLGDVYKRQILTGELANRNSLIRNGTQVASSDPEALFQAAFGGGAWADPLNGTWQLTGRLFDGTSDRGPCAINCSNARSVSTHSDPNRCLLYTSDAADDLLCVDLGGRRSIKKKKRVDVCYYM
eukprot:TRINITY_DN24910_c0_g1_i1.p1 TRINITY_DN24910_c0_g1~~TRINITY_DN24910_c0_g1_i1.p1  ORF type:complete len:143 (-),score=55.82 TRINITY_DN24910_c0_g1_i1:12-440(-)